nr:probable peroxisomal acyl-coenzyme A oxidase 1 [Cherax quadricarinatus]
MEVGVPQESVLGPLFFLIYISDLPNASQLLKPILFADDTTYVFSHPNTVILANTVNAKLQKISAWMMTNKLTLNTDKTCFIQFGNKAVNDPINITLNGSSVTRLTEGKFLGIHHDSSLKFQRHIQQITKKISKTVGILSKIRQPEPQILDYQTQQYKLLPQIATIFGIHFSTKDVWDTYNEVTGNIHEGNLDLLPELHALSCGLKALSSSDAASGIEICRLACGGHGYLSSSNLPRIYTTTTAAITYEGENTVMWLQVARYLIKSYREARQGQRLQHSVSYLTAQPASAYTTSELSNADLVEAFKKAVSSMISETAARLQQYCDMGKPFEHAWNSCSVLLVKCAQAHIRYFTCVKYVAGIENAELSEGGRNVLRRLCRLYLIYHITLNQGDFLRSGSLTSHHISTLEGEMCNLLAALRHDAVSLVDSFDIHDRILDSTLGCWDGNVYQRMFDEAQKSPLNQTDVPEAYYKYLRPLMKANL